MREIQVNMKAEVAPSIGHLATATEMLWGSEIPGTAVNQFAVSTVPYLYPTTSTFRTHSSGLREVHSANSA